MTLCVKKNVSLKYSFISFSMAEQRVGGIAKRLLRSPKDRKLLIHDRPRSEETHKRIKK